MDFSPLLTLEICAKCKNCCVFKPESLIYAPKGIDVASCPCGTFVCVHRCENAGCGAGENKPMECKAWPFSVSKRGKELLLVLEHNCPELNKKEKIEQAKKFALEDVAGPLLEYSKQHLDTLREHDERNEVIQIYPDSI
jgi:hypothetical protein